MDFFEPDNATCECSVSWRNRSPWLGFFHRNLDLETLPFTRQSGWGEWGEKDWPSWVNFPDPMFIWRWTRTRKDRKWEVNLGWFYSTPWFWEERIFCKQEELSIRPVGCKMSHYELGMYAGPYDNENQEWFWPIYHKWTVKTARENNIVSGVSMTVLLTTVKTLRGLNGSTQRKPSPQHWVPSWGRQAGPAVAKGRVLYAQFLSGLCFTCCLQVSPWLPWMNGCNL